MSTTTNGNLLPVYSCKKLMLWPMVDETNETYGDPISLEGDLMTYDDSVSTNTSKLYGDGQVAAVDVIESDGTLALGIHGLSDEVYAKLFNALKKQTTTGSITSVTEDGTEMSPYFCVALSAPCNGEHVVNLRKWMKVRFGKFGESVQQKTDNKTYSTPTLNGSYLANSRLGVKRARAAGVDISTVAGAAFEANWYGNPEYTGGDGMVNSTIITADGTATTNGATVATGSAIVMTGAASGGTSPYTYAYSYQRRGSNTWTSLGTGASSTSVTVSADGIYDFKVVATDSKQISIEKVFTLTAETSNG